MNGVVVLGVICLGLGVIMFVAIDRRKFYRRNQFGIETFRSYSGSVMTRFAERLLRLLAKLLLLAGLGLIGLWYYAVN